MNIENCDFCDSHSSKINTTFNGTFCSCFVRCFKTILIIHDTIVSKGNILRNLNKLQFGSNSTHLSHSATTNTHQTNEHFFRLLAKWNVIYFGKMCRFFWWWFHWLSNVHKKVIWNLHCFFFLKKKITMAQFVCWKFKYTFIKLLIPKIGHFEPVAYSSLY